MLTLFYFFGYIVYFPVYHLSFRLLIHGVRSSLLSVSYLRVILDLTLSFILRLKKQHETSSFMFFFSVVFLRCIISSVFFFYALCLYLCSGVNLCCCNIFFLFCFPLDVMEKKRVLFALKKKGK